MGVVEKEAKLKPLAKRSDQHSFFLVSSDDTIPPDYMPGVSLELVEWPRTLVVSEYFDSAVVLAGLPDGSILELLRVPGNRNKRNYDAGTPLMRFRGCVRMRQFSRFDGGVLELGVVFDCKVTIL